MKQLTHNQQATELYQEFLIGSAELKVRPLEDRATLLHLLDDVLDSYNRLKFDNEVTLCYQEYAS